jgi:hypothetical protein
MSRPLPCAGQGTNFNRSPMASFLCVCICRLVPRKGAGPGLRSGGHEIDEYLMRLLRTGSAYAAEAPFYHNEVCSSYDNQALFWFQRARDAIEALAMRSW